jgi:solute carrier family 30 (zinc transporter), member 9
MLTGSSLAVYSALIGNTLVMTGKFIAFFATGSSAMLSEAIHSLADVSNQALLALGIARSRKLPDRDHPYGYARERYIWALISAVGIFFLGCGLTLYHGVHTMLNPRPIQDYDIAFITLLFSFIVEGSTLAIAVKAIRQVAHKEKQTFMQHLREGSDPMGVAVVLEDSAAVLGVVIASLGLFLTHLTQNSFWDSLATILIAILLGFVAIFLTVRTKGLLIGMAIPLAERTKILKILKSDPIVEKVYDVKTAIIGANNHRFKAEVEFDGEKIARKYLQSLDVSAIAEKITTDEELEKFLIRYGDHIIGVLGDEIDRLEAKIKEQIPSIRHIDIEVN